MYRRALLVGINYEGTSSALQGCINDVANVQEYLVGKRGYSAENVVVCTDNTPLKPTRSNILSLLSQLILSEAQVLYFHYSGHGSYISDVNGDEDDGRDECLVPLDYQRSGMITDDDMRAIVSLLPAGKKMGIVLDCCHSGTGIDLAYNLYKRAGRYTMIRNPKYSETKCHVMMLSGCADYQTSADAYLQGKYQGALTHAFLTAMNEGVATYDQLITRVRTVLKQGRFQQLPNLSSGREVSLSTKIAV